MPRTSLPLGFRFHPTDVELIKFYLKRKVMGKRICSEVIADIDIYKYAPWDLPDKSCLKSKDLEWYFFCPRERKYTNGARMNRATEYGYWKTTGKDRSVLYNEQIVGMIKTLIFHTGRAPQGDRTDWVMHEYRLDDKDLTDAGVIQDAYVLCKIFQKRGLGPRNGAQYGAPFNEEEWSDDEEVNGAVSFPISGLSAPAPALTNNQDRSTVTSTFIRGTICIGSSSKSTPSKTVQSPDNILQPIHKDDVSMLEIPLLHDDDDILSLLDCFTDDIILVPKENETNENLDKVNHKEIIQTASLDANSIFNDLPELGKWPELSEDGLYFSNGTKTDFATNQMLACQDGLYLELNDLQFPLGGSSDTCGSESTPIDAVPSHYNFYNSSEQPCYPVNFFDAVQHASVISQSSVLPEGSYGVENHLDVFQEDNGVKEDTSQGYQAYEATLNNVEGNQPELGSRYAS